MVWTEWAIFVGRRSTNGHHSVVGEEDDCNNHGRAMISRFLGHLGTDRRLLAVSIPVTIMCNF